MPVDRLHALPHSLDTRHHGSTRKPVHPREQTPDRSALDAPHVQVRTEYPGRGDLGEKNEEAGRGEFEDGAEGEAAGVEVGGEHCLVGEGEAAACEGEDGQAVVRVDEAVGLEEAVEVGLVCVWEIGGK